jgi:tetratricopeptide (TPR) repeat protein
MSVTYAADLPAELPLDSVTAGVVLAECYRKHGRTSEAIGLLQQLAGGRPDPHFFLALAELYSETGDHDDLASLIERPDVKSLPFEYLTVIQAFHADALIGKGREEEAFSLMESSYLTWYAKANDLAVLVVLCTVFLDSGRWDDVIRTVASYEVTNSDDNGFKLKLLQAQAMDNKGLDEAALAIYKELLKSKPRDPTKFATTVAQIEREQRQRAPELLKESRYLRGRLYLKMGKHAMGNRDLSAVYADDPNYRDVAQLLEA